MCVYVCMCVCMCVCVCVCVCVCACVLKIDNGVSTQAGLRSCTISGSK